MNKFDLGVNPRTGRARMRRQGVGSMGAADLRGAIRQLPLESRARLAAVLALAVQVRLHPRDLLEFVRVYEPALILFGCAMLWFSLLATSVLTCWVVDPQRPLLASNVLWYGTLAVAAAAPLASAALVVRARRSRAEER